MALAIEMGNSRTDEIRLYTLGRLIGGELEPEFTIAWEWP